MAQSINRGRARLVFLDGIWLKRSWGGEVRNVSVLVAIGVNQDGYREVLGVAEGTKEDKASWQNFLRYLASRGLNGMRLFVGDKVPRLGGEPRGVLPAGGLSALRGPLLP